MTERIAGLSMLFSGEFLLLLMFIGLFEPSPISLPVASIIGLPGVLLSALGVGLLIAEGGPFREDSAEDGGS
jgi:hypothetical protein